MAWTERYVRADADGSGDGTTDTNSGVNGAWTLAQAATSAASGHRVNVRSGTYSMTSSSVSISGTGTTTAPIWWRGFYATPGDIDSDTTLTRPSITVTTGSWAPGAGTLTYFSHLKITKSAGSGSAVYMNNNIRGARWDNCYISNTDASSSAVAVYSDSSSTITYTRCHFDCTSSSTAVVNFTGGTSSPAICFSECIFTGGGDGIRMNPNGAATHFIFERCCFRGTGAYGIKDSGDGGSCLYVFSCSFRTASEAILLAATRTGGGNGQGLIANCAFGDVVYGINNNTGTNTGLIHRCGNLFGSYSSGKENGMGDSPSVDEMDDGGTSPFTSSTDLTIKSSSAGYQKGETGAWPGESYSSYGDVGAVPHQDSGSSGISNRIIQATNIGTY